MSVQPNNTLPATLPRNTEDLAAAVSAQWGRAQQGLLEILKFGAIMLELERRLAPGVQRAGTYEGETIKSWLGRHCPEINYKTAHGYKQATAGVIRAAGLPEELPLLALMDGDAALAQHHEDARARVMEVVATASIAELKVMGRPKKRGGLREGAGRPPKQEPDANATMNEALMLADKLVGDLSVWVLGDDGFGNLPDDVLQQCVTILSDITKRGRDILSGRKLAAKAPAKQGARTNDTLSDTIER